MKCPTRVEICSCTWKEDQSKDNTIGIKNGYKYVINYYFLLYVDYKDVQFLLNINKLYRWLLDIIVKNYTALNNKVKNQNVQGERNIEVQSIALDSPSKLSIHSNPFKPIKELVLKKVIL